MVEFRSDALRTSEARLDALEFQLTTRFGEEFVARIFDPAQLDAVKEATSRGKARPGIIYASSPALLGTAKPVRARNSTTRRPYRSAGIAIGRGYSGRTMTGAALASIAEFGTEPRFTKSGAYRGFVPARGGTFFRELLGEGRERTFDDIETFVLQRWEGSDGNSIVSGMNRSIQAAR